MSPALWANTAKGGLLKYSLKHSEFDPCLFYRPGMTVVLNVDDAGIGGKSPADTNDLIASLDLRNFNESLGMKLHKKANGSIGHTQTGLIDKILEAAGSVPAIGTLASDPDGEPMDASWNYRSIVVMLLYLSMNTRPDISFAVSKVARFSANPKASAVKMILRFLKRTRNKGMIIKIDDKLTLDLFVVADFCGLFKVEPDANSNAVRSRTEFVVL